MGLTTAETLTRAGNGCSYAGMSDVLDHEKQQQIVVLGRLGWTLSRIQATTGVRRETVTWTLPRRSVSTKSRGDAGVPQRR